MAQCNCGCNEITLVYACSGAANTGLLADQVARNLMKDCCAKMTCLAAVGAELSGFIESAKAAKQNILIDGCQVSCGKKIFEKLSLPYNQFIVTDFGVEKGKTEITQPVIERVSKTIKDRIPRG
ncbi:MAG: putative zinc-binding protein [Spirochaetales bacterium]|nr:putative zinc-binding protein [Spirochaetales bacterium]